MNPLLRTLRRPASLLQKRAFSTAPSSDRIGIIGVGLMGGQMASNMLKGGRDVVVYDLDANNADAIVAKGAAKAASPLQVAEMCDTVITMLPSTASVQETYLGENGLHQVLRKEHLFIDSSTIDPVATKGVSKGIHDLGASYVDAPVSGGVAGATNGTLTFMIGGTADEFDRAKERLTYMGKNFVHCGGSSTGQAAKICNNLALAIQMHSVAEALNLGETLGLDPKVLSGIMATSTGQCWSVTVNNPYPGVMENVPSSNGYKGGFMTKLMWKDLNLAVTCAKAVDQTMPMTYNSFQLFNMMKNEGHGDKDFSYILQYLKHK